jgi:hypothetical protein
LSSTTSTLSQQLLSSSQLVQPRNSNYELASSSFAYSPQQVLFNDSTDFVLEDLLEDTSKALALPLPDQDIAHAFPTARSPPIILPPPEPPDLHEISENDHNHDNQQSYDSNSQYADSQPIKTSAIQRKSQRLQNTKRQKDILKSDVL